VTAALAVRGLRVAFGDRTAVDGLDLSVEAGEVFGLLGPNGAGKTTTLRVINGLLPVAVGEVSVFGVAVGRRPMAVRRLVGYVPQMLSLDGGLTGRENVALFARLFDVPRRERAARVAEAIESVGLTGVADRLAKHYSGGMARRMELAQALVSDPRLLILDEPTTGLDPVAREAVWARIAFVRRERAMTILVTTHNMEEAQTVCDRVALLRAGRVRALGTPAGLIGALGRPGSLEDVFRAHAGPEPATGEETTGEEKGRLRDVHAARRAARR
jgi:ABC-2 type transport system ATP-binding protein